MHLLYNMHSHEFSRSPFLLFTYHHLSQYPTTHATYNFPQPLLPSPLTDWVYWLSPSQPGCLPTDALTRAVRLYISATPFYHSRRSDCPQIFSTGGFFQTSTLSLVGHSPCFWNSRLFPANAMPPFRWMTAQPTVFQQAKFFFRKIDILHTPAL